MLEATIGKVLDWPAWLRSALSLPVSAFVYVAAFLATGIFGKLLSFFGRDGMSTNFFDYLISPYCAGYAAAFVVVYLAAPSRNMQVGFMAAWMLAFGGLAYFAFWSLGLKGLFGVMCSVAGGLYGFYATAEQIE